MWIAPEQRDPVVPHAPTCKSVGCFGAVNLSTGRLVTQVCPVFNGETFAAFVRKMLRHRGAGQRMVLVLNPAAYHHARVLAPLLHGHRKNLRLFFLPPYSPPLSSIERLWERPRRLATRHRHFPTLPAVLGAVTACFNRRKKTERDPSPSRPHCSSRCAQNRYSTSRRTAGVSGSRNLAAGVPHRSDSCRANESKCASPPKRATS
jgi:transposase